MKSNTIEYRGEIFTRTSYNGISVLIDSNGYYNASKICKDNGKRFRDVVRNDYWTSYIEHLGMVCKIAPVDLIKERVNLSKELRGIYIHKKLVNWLCEHLNLDYAIQVGEIMDVINERNHIEMISLEERIEQYKQEIEELKDQIHDLTTPINKLAQPSCIYAKPIGNDHFQLRYSKEPISKYCPNLRHIEMINAYDVRELVLKEAEERKLIIHKDRRMLFTKDKLDIIFKMIAEAKQNISNPVNILSKREFIDKRLAKIRSKPVTRQTDGKIFELELISKKDSLIPWSMLPRRIMNAYNEQARDLGIDAVTLNGDKITEIVQIKHSSTNHALRYADVSKFLEKASQDRYKGITKRIYIHNLYLGKKLKKTIEDLNIIVDTIE